MLGFRIESQGTAIAPAAYTMRLPETPLFRLDGRTALVTGASSGIGLAAAAALAGAGAHVVCVARRAEPLDEAVTAMRERGDSAEAVPLDVSDVEATTDFVESHDPFDAVVNAAGLARHGPALATQADDYDAVMGVNLRAAYFLSQAVARGMVKRGSGSIIHVSSQMGHVGGMERAVYCASKWGLEGMVRAMAVEWGPRNVRINTLAPTFVRTPFTEKVFNDPDRRAWVEREIVLGRVAEGPDLMGAILYLASDASAMVTGTSLLVDGGWTAK